MDNRAGFLETILATPDDDAPRLVFSDWLEDHGDPARAELIRAQCASAQLSPSDRRYCELAWRIEALLVENRARWIAELPSLDGVEWLDFERGFVATVRVPDVKVLYRQQDRIASAAPIYRVELGKLDESKTPRPEGAVPWMRALRLSGRDTHRTDPNASLLQGVSELEVTQMHEYHDARWLTTFTVLESLRTIRLRGSHTAGQAIAAWVAGNAGIHPTSLELGTRFVDYNSGYFDDPTMGPTGTVGLAQATHLKDLEVLNLNRQRVGTPGFQAVVASPTLAKVRELAFRAGQIEDFRSLDTSIGLPLRSLDLSLTQISNGGARTLSRARRLAELESLTLDTCEVASKGLEHLTKAPFWMTLRVLNLSRNPLGAAGATVLAAAKPPKHLHTLTLVDCDLDDVGSATLTGISWLRQLLALDLSSNVLEEAAVTGLARLADGSLRKLALASSGLDEVSIAALAPLWPKLIHLDLSGNALGTDGLPALLRGGPAVDLLSLGLSDCSLSQKGLTKLFKDPVCPRLHTLDLSRNSLTVRVTDQLLASPLLNTVRELKLNGCNLSDASARRIAEAAALANCSTINLYDNKFGEEGLLALAASPHLTGVTLRLSGNPWTYKEKSRKILENRFGRYWYNSQEEEEEQEQTDDFDDDFDDEFDDD